jgi:hypothetical protein
MKIKPNVGDSVKCSADSGGVLRVMSDNLIRGYPNPEIAASWNSNWSANIKDIDCGAYTTGEALEEKPPEVPTDNDSEMKCYLARYPDLRRAFGNDLNAANNHWTNNGQREGRDKSCNITDAEADSYLNGYPDLKAAFGTNRIKARKHFYTNGKNEERNFSGPVYDLFNKGDSVKCAGEDNGTVYRAISDNEIRAYPNPDIAATWNSNWGANIKNIDCTGLTKGGNMKIKPNVGDSVKCSADSGGILRVTDDNTIRGYPNPDIAASWNSNWNADIKDINCDLYTTGAALDYNWGTPNDLSDAQAQCYLNRYADVRAAFGYNNIAAAKKHWKDNGKGEGRDFTCDNDPGKQFDTIPDGRAIRCQSQTGNTATYRYVGDKTIRGYPNQGVASSWDPNWASQYTEVDCRDFTIGGNMKTKPNVGDSVKCSADSGGVLRVMSDNLLRGYPNPTIAATWNSNWNADIKDIECGLYTTGEALGYNLSEGQSIACDATSGGRYRYTGGKKRGYPNTTIAGSWDSNWNSPKIVNCADIPDGPVMKIKPNVGDSVKCSADSGAILRVMSDNLIRGYPNPDIAASWNSNWNADIKDIDCDAYTTGANLGYKP